MRLTSANLLAETGTRTFYEFARLHSLTEWWQWLLLLVTVLGVLAYVGYMYWRDGVDLPRGLAVTLLVLRVAALLGLLFYFLQLEKRTERKLVRNSRVLVVADTSQSMGLRDGQGGTASTGPTRIEQVAAELAGENFIPTLRKQHDVILYRFDQQNQPVQIAAYPKLPAAEGESEEDEAVAAADASRDELERMLLIAGGLFVLSFLLAAIYAFTRPKKRGEEQTSWALLASMVLLIVSLVTVAVGNLRHPELGLLGIGGDDVAETETSPGAGGEPTQAETPKVDFLSELAARGAETRLGEALRFLVNKERGGPIAGVVVFTDGNNNAGVDPQIAINAAVDAKLSIFPVGLGTDQRPVNVRVVDLEAPARVYPGDHFTVSGYLQGFGLAKQNVKVELLSAPDTPGAVKPADMRFEDEDRVELGASGEVVGVKFEVEPKEVGRRIFLLKVTPPAGDNDKNDNEKTAKVQIVERKSKVLLVAGGPTREYQFVRNLLYRDKQTTVDVLLQTGKPGLSQEANDLLNEFPQEADELFEYDCIVAFDPDWSKLDQPQAELLERFVAEKAGGLILVAGPVHTPQWSSQRRGEPKIDTIKGLYPVVFYSQAGPGLRLGRYGAEQAWPLTFSREGQSSEFLWLEDTSIGSEQAWAAFPGVYGYFSIKDVKPGTTVYARFSDPESSIDNQFPVYFASQFYGAGRVFYMASGEMWRLRSVEETYFDQFYTKLIRWATQGRLLRDSSRGVLLVDKERCLVGDTVAVRASLNDSQHRPLTAEEVSALLVHPDGKRTPFTLRKVKDTSRDGLYSGQFTAASEGDWRIELQLPNAGAEELLTREVRVRIPTLEIEKPERNNALLSTLAASTGGYYYLGVEAAAGRSDVPGVDKKLLSHDLITSLPGAPDKMFERQLMGWLLAFICGALCLEWLIRRLSKLA